jgi:hypothetical protein
MKHKTYEKCSAYKTCFFFSTMALHSIYALMLEMRPQIHAGPHAKWYCCIIFTTTKQLHKFLYISQKPCFEDIHSKVLELLHANKWTASRHMKGWMERVLIYVQKGCKHT